MLTIKQILGATPRATQLSSRDVTLSKVERKVKRVSRNPILRAVTSTNVDANGRPKSKISKYQTSVEGLMGDGSLISQKYVKVSCSCDAFTYWGSEWALHKQGAADIVHSNGQPPDIRNPRYTPHCCKHVAALLQYVLRKGL